MSDRSKRFCHAATKRNPADRVDRCSASLTRQTCSGCTAHSHKRRTLLKVVAGISTLGLWGSDIGAVLASIKPGNDQLPQPGDHLAADNSDGAIVALKPADIPENQDPLLAYPFDPKTKKLRNQKRFNGVLLLRFKADRIDKRMESAAAGNVLAYSAICVHAACEISTYMPQEKTFLCFCHGSQYYPLQDGKVAAGPAPRALPNLPLTQREGVLVVAKHFNASVGPA